MRVSDKLSRALTALLLLSGAGTAAPQTKSESPVELVRQTVENEIQANNGGAKFMFLDRKQTAHGSQAKLIVETREATAGILVEVNGKPLSPEQRQAEEARLERLASNPEELKKKQKSEREDTQRTIRIMKALPDAFLYEREGTEPGRPDVGNPSDELVRLRFRPNPRYNPPSHIEQVLTGMQGYLLIDENKRRVAMIDGTLFKEVGFGWGILGHLDKGGHFVVQQGEVCNGVWEVTRMNLALTGKELLFKSIIIKVDEEFTDFRPAPADLTFAQAVELLRKQEAELAVNRQQIDATNPSRR